MPTMERLVFGVGVRELILLVLLFLTGLLPLGIMYFISTASSDTAPAPTLKKAEQELPVPTPQQFATNELYYLNSTVTL